MRLSECGEYRNGESIKTLTGHSSPVCSVIFYRNGKYLASGSSDKIIGLWRVSSEKCIKTFIGHSSHVCSVVFSPDGKYLASGSADKTIGLWKSIWRLDPMTKLSECGGYRAENSSKHSQATFLKSLACFFLQTESIWFLNLRTRLLEFRDFLIKN